MKCPHCGQDNAGSDVCFACGRRLPVASGTGVAGLAGSPAKPQGAGSIVLSPGTVLHGRWEISNEKWPNGKTWNEGGQGVVYFAIDRQVENRLCVVKQVKEEVTSDAVLQKLKEEAKRMADLSRAIGGRMAEILDEFVEGRRFYVVEQRIPGDTLQAIFNRNNSLKEADVVAWTVQCCKILQRIHEHKALHRDISPDNLMLTKVGDIMFIDFGTLREFQRIMQGTQGMGKMGFAPPEQWAGKPVEQSDIFALGATTYYLLTAGFLPVSDEFKAGRGFMQSDLSPAFPPIRTKNPSVSAGLERVLARALDLDFRKRYASADEMRIDLEKLTAKPVGITPPQVAYCPKCGQPNEHHLVYCKYCETVLSAGSQACPNPKCPNNKGNNRKGIPANAKFCPRCGAPTGVK